MPIPPDRSAGPPRGICAANPIEIRLHGDFLPWLAQMRGTLAVSTYNSGKVALFAAPGGAFSASYWKFARPMGLAVQGERLAVATLEHVSVYQVMEPRLSASTEGVQNGSQPKLQLLALERSYFTRRIDAHDLAFDRRGLLLANTRFNSVSRPSDQVSFLQHWRPWFIRAPVRRDCCHLNGLGVKEGRLAMATAFCDRGEAAAWREGNRFASGVLIDVPRQCIAASGLNMPHSPRWHEGRWWVCNSGEGTLGVLDAERRAVESVAALPGFTRGLSFAAGRAVVGLSRIRRRHILDAPPVRSRWPSLQAGIALVCPQTGHMTGGVEFLRGGREVYDVAYLPDFTRLEFAPSAIEREG